MDNRRRGQFWCCNACGAQNHETDGECQYCECGGVECKRDNCDDARHAFDTDDADAIGRERCTHTAGVCDRLVCDKEATR